jgi:hypothetical protein
MDMQKSNLTLPGQPQDKFNQLAEQTRLDMPRYEAPTFMSYTDQDILEKLGPALTGGGSGSGFR